MWKNKLAVFDFVLLSVSLPQDTITFGSLL